MKAVAAAGNTGSPSKRTASCAAVHGMRGILAFLRRLRAVFCTGCVWLFSVLLAIVGSIVSLVVAATTLYGTMQYELRQNALREADWQTTAEVLSAKQTRVYYNEDPEIAIALRVQMLSGATVDVDTKWFVPFIDLPKMQPGSIKVLVDRRDPKNIMRL